MKRSRFDVLSFLLAYAIIGVGSLLALFAMAVSSRGDEPEAKYPFEVVPLAPQTHLVIFGYVAKHSPACVEIERTWQALERVGWKVRRIDIDTVNGQAMRMTYEIRGVPTTQIMSKNRLGLVRELERLEGAAPVKKFAESLQIAKERIAGPLDAQEHPIRPIPVAEEPAAPVNAELKTGDEYVMQDGSKGVVQGVTKHASGATSAIVLPANGAKTFEKPIYTAIEDIPAPKVNGISFGVGKEFGKKYPYIRIAGEALDWDEKDGWYHFHGESCPYSEYRGVRAMISNFGGKWVLAGADQIDRKTGKQYNRAGPDKWEFNGRTFVKGTQDGREVWNEKTREVDGIMLLYGSPGYTEQKTGEPVKVLRKTTGGDYLMRTEKAHKLDPRPGDLFQTAEMAALQKAEASAGK